MQKDGGADLDLYNILWCKMKTVIVYFGTKLVLISRVIVTTIRTNWRMNIKLQSLTHHRHSVRHAESCGNTSFTSLKHCNKADDSTLGIDSI